MKTNILAVLLLATGCLDSEEPMVHLPEPEVAVEEEANVEQFMICGENTVASARTAAGTRVMFCVQDGVELVAERGAPSGLARGECALDRFVELTDETTPVPAALVRSCEERTGREVNVARTIVETPVFATTQNEDLRAQFVTINLPDYARNDGTSYCGPSSEYSMHREAFRSQVCYYQNFQCWDDQSCADWCYVEAATTLDIRTSTTLGEGANNAYATLSSCNGTTRFMAQRDRGAVDPSYVTLFDVSVTAGTTWTLHMYYSSSVHGDANFRYYAKSASFAWHRSAGIFDDDK